jgi:carboxymethylenebutenolidase
MSFSTITGSTETTLHTDAQGLREGMTEIQSFDQKVQAYYAVPEGVERPPVVLVVQEIFGVHEHIKDVCRRFAHEGYMAVAVELYQRQGDAAAFDDMKALIAQIVAKTPDEQVLADLDTAVRWAASLLGGPHHLALCGA